jgi:hypothetical protein
MTFLYLGNYLSQTLLPGEEIASDTFGGIFRGIDMATWI